MLIRISGPGSGDHLILSRLGVGVRFPSGPPKSLYSCVFKLYNDEAKDGVIERSPPVATKLSFEGFFVRRTFLKVRVFFYLSSNRLCDTRS